MAYSFGNTVVVMVEEVIPMACTSNPSTTLTEVAACCGKITRIMGMYGSFVGSIAINCSDGEEELAGVAIDFLP